MGGYSKGCFHCRRRKIKCDEQRPTCAHCIRRGDTCRYPDPTRVVFRSMTSGIVARYGSPGAPLPVQPSLDWEDQARMHFFHHYVVSPAAFRRGYLEFLPELLEQNPNHLALKHAFAAVSMAQLANMQNLANLSTDAQAYYGLALREVAATMKDVDAASTDCGLISIVLLQKYELLCGLKKGPYDAHDVGLTHLIATRRRQGKTPPGDQGLSFIIDGRRHMNKLDGAPDPGIGDSNITGVFPAGKQLWGLLTLLVGLCGKMRQMMALNGGVPSTTAIFRTWSEASAALRRLRSWQHDAPPQVAYKSIALSLPSLTALYTFDHMQHGVMWIGLWSSQIRLAQTMLAFGRIFDLLDKIGTPPSQAGRSEIQFALMEAVDCICSCSSYMLGEVDTAGRPNSKNDSPALGAYFLVRGLAMASEVDDISDDQHRLIFDKLGQIGHAKGIKQALRARERRIFQYSSERDSQ